MTDTPVDMLALFARDPANLTDQDLDANIAEYRSARKYFNLGNKRAGSTKPAAKKTNEIANLSLSSNLELDI